MIIIIRSVATYVLLGWLKNGYDNTSPGIIKVLAWRHKKLKVLSDSFERSRSSLSVNFINILCAPFAPIVFSQKLQSQNVTRKMLQESLLYEKFALTLLMKLTLEEFWLMTDPWDEIKCWAAKSNNS